MNREAIRTPARSVSNLDFFHSGEAVNVYTLSLHDALPILRHRAGGAQRLVLRRELFGDGPRSEEHTSELQSLRHLVCRLLLEKKKHEGSWLAGSCARRGRPLAAFSPDTTGTQAHGEGDYGL